MGHERLYTQGNLKKIFPHIPANTLLFWAREGLVPWTEERTDSRGVHRLYSVKNLYTLGVVERMLSWGINPQIVREIAPMPGIIRADYIAVQELDQAQGGKRYHVIMITGGNSFDILKERNFTVSAIINVGWVKKEVDTRIKAAGL